MTNVLVGLKELIFTPQPLAVRGIVRSMMGCRAGEQADGQEFY